MIAVDYINDLRRAELEAVVAHLRPSSRILEVGAGTGQQAMELERRGFEISAIDLATSDYSGHRVFPVIDYEGSTIPFEDGSFDAIFTSHVLEHVPDLPRLQAELKRVLRPGGECLHVLPTHVWRFWTSAAAIPAVLAPFRHGLGPLMNLRRSASSALKSHGESGNVLTELWHLHPRRWRRTFRDAGFDVVEDRPVGFFYTGEVLFGGRLGFAKRRGLGRVLGSSAHFYRLRRREQK